MLVTCERTQVKPSEALALLYLDKKEREKCETAAFQNGVVVGVAIGLSLATIIGVLTLLSVGFLG